MSVFCELPAPPIREDGLPHAVCEFDDGTWACMSSCPSCRAAGIYLHGGKPRRRRRTSPLT